MTTLDIVAFAWFAGLLALYEIAMSVKSIAAKSLTEAVQAQRRRWIANMAGRDQRQYDAILMANLTQSLAFFASTSVLGIGGLAAVVGQGEMAKAMLEQLPYVQRGTASAWELKVLFMMGILIYAFFKFAWAFRLSHYTVMAFGAMPPPGSADAAGRQRHAAEVANLLGLVGDHANAGLRSFYYTFAAIAWLFHPAAFMVATTIVIVVLVRREFFSRASAILRSMPPDTCPIDMV